MITSRRVILIMLRKKLKLDPIEAIQGLSTQLGTTLESEGTIQASATTSIANELLKLELDLNESLKQIKFKKPVEYVYCPLDYAYQLHATFTQKYCLGIKKILFVGMNPGPWGMCQTGIPFGEVNIVKDWFRISGNVLKPENECPERKVVGLTCPRSEISGQRIWGLFKNICGTPENFFKSAFMYNYCPIAMLKNNGGNITPTEIKGEAQRQLEESCDKTLLDVIKLLQIEIVVGVGKFSEKRTLEVIKKNNLHDVKVIYLLHPSPRVANNQNWLVTAEKRLNELQLMPYFKQ